MEHKNIKIIFMGTPEFAAGIFESLINAGYQVAAVFTQPDKKIGRRREISVTSVKKLALEKNIQIFQPENMRDSGLVEEIRKIKPNLIIVAAYGKILPEVILEIPKFGAINVHASLLPKFRGASPVQQAILSGEKETGITLIKMNEKMDEGDILAQEKIEIGENNTAEILLKKLGKLGAKMTTKFVPGWIAGKIKPVPQDEKKASYCKIVKREDGKIDWNESAEEIFRKFRAFSPWPGIFAFYKKKNDLHRLKLVKILAAGNENTGEKPGKVVKYGQDIAVQTGKGLIILREVQPEGKKTMEIRDFLRGNADFKNAY